MAIKFQDSLEVKGGNASKVYLEGAGGTGSSTMFQAHNPDDGAGHGGGTAYLKSSGWGEAQLAVGGYRWTQGGGKMTVTGGVYYFNTGNVGIKTGSPDYTLDVNGVIRATNFISVKGNSNSNITEYNQPVSTSVNLGTYLNQYAFIDLSSSAASGSWIDFSKADGSDYSGRIRYQNYSDELQIFTSGRLVTTIKSDGIATGSWGHVKVYMSNRWGGSGNYYPTIGSEDGSAGSLIMLDNPHVPWSTENSASSSYDGRAGLRLERPDRNGWWDAGLAGDFYHIYRGGTGELLKLTNTGNLTVSGSVSATGGNSGQWNIGYQNWNTYLSNRTIGDADEGTRQGFSVDYLLNTSPFNPDSSLLTMSYSSIWSWQMAGDWRTGGLRFRGKNGGTWGDWQTAATEEWVASQGYITSETDSQTLSWNGSNGQLTISSGNTVDLDGRYEDAGAAEAVNVRIDEEILPAIDSKVSKAGDQVAGALSVGGSAAYDSNLALDVQGSMGIWGSNKLYFKITSDNYNTWSTSQYANGSQHKFNAQSFSFTNEGYSASVFMNINSSGVGMSRNLVLGNEVYGNSTAYGNWGARLMFNGSNSDAQGNYYIGTNGEDYGGNYSKLDLRWHTGIRMGAQAQYGGIRFYDNEDLNTRIMSIGETDNNIRIDNNLWIGGAGGWITDLLAGKANASHTHSYLPLSGGTLTGNLVTPSIDVETFYYHGTQWYEKKYVRSVGLSGSAIGNSWVLLGTIVNNSSYERSHAKFTIHGYDDVSSGTEIIIARAENSSTAQEIHSLNWYSNDSTANLFSEVQSIRQESSGLLNVYEIWVKMSGDWRDTFTVSLEWWNSHSREFNIDSSTVLPEGETPVVSVDNISQNTRRWYIGSEIFATGGDSNQWNTAYGWGNHASAGYENASNLSSGTVPYSRTNKVLPTSGSYVWDASSSAGNYETGVQTSFVRGSDGFPDYGAVLHVGARGGGDAGGDFQIFCGHGSANGGNHLRFRNADNNANPTDSWTAFKTLWDSENFDPATKETAGSAAAVEQALNIRIEEEVLPAIDSKLDATAKAADSELLDGINSSSFVRSDATDTLSGHYTFSYNSGVIGSAQPGYTQGAIEIITSANNSPAIGFHRGGYSATSLYEYDGQLYVNPWTTRAQEGLLLSSGNISAYADAAGAAAAVNDRIDTEVIPQLTDHDSRITTNRNNIISLGTTKLSSDVSDVYNGRTLSFGTAGNGTNTSGAFLTIEGNTDTSGEGSGRMFFREHNSTTAAADNYGFSIGYRGGSTAINSAMGNSWTGLGQIGNGAWGMWGHNNSSEGALIMHGDRAGTYVDFSGNNIQGITDAYIADQIIHTGDTNTYMQFHAADQWRVVTGGGERLEVNNGAVEVANDFKVYGSYTELGNAIGSVTNDGNWNARLNVAGSSHARLDVKSVSDGIITTMYSHTGHGVGKLGTYSNHPAALIVNGTSQVIVGTDGSLSPVNDRAQLLGLDSNRWQIVFCEILDSAGQHEKNLQNPEGEKSVGEYETGTVLVWKDGKNVPCTEAADHMRMGIAVKDVSSPLVQGAEPVLCTGEVNEGDYLVTSSVEGHAAAISPQYMRQHGLYDCVIGKALESAEGKSHLVKTWVNI